MPSNNNKFIDREFIGNVCFLLTIITFLLILLDTTRSTFWFFVSMVLNGISLLAQKNQPCIDSAVGLFLGAGAYFIALLLESDFTAFPYWQVVHTYAFVQVFVAAVFRVMKNGLN